MNKKITKFTNYINDYWHCDISKFKMNKLFYKGRKFHHLSHSKALIFLPLSLRKNKRSIKNVYFKSSIWDCMYLRKSTTSKEPLKDVAGESHIINLLFDIEITWDSLAKITWRTRNWCMLFEAKNAPVSASQIIIWASSEPAQWGSKSFYVRIEWDFTRYLLTPR